MKLPNGFGSVTKLSGKRRKPYLARVTVGWDIDPESEKAIQKRIPIGTFRTKAEALNALSNYSADPYSLSSNDMTLGALFDKWSAEYLPTLASQSSRRAVLTAWNYCQDIHSMKVKDVRTRHIKAAINDGYIIPKSGKNAGEKVFISPNTKKKLKTIFNLMMDYAVEYELTDRNYSRIFNLTDVSSNSKSSSEKAHIVFSDDEMKKLWDNVDAIKYVDWILIQCYMGWRPTELLTIELDNVDMEHLSITGGIKTDAGKDRAVPIHHRIAPLVKRIYDIAVILNSKYLFNDDSPTRDGRPVSYYKYQYRFTSVMNALGLNPNHKPHDPRKTFVTMAKKAGVDEYSIKIMAGHYISDITEAVYTERDLEWLRKEIEKIP